MNRRDFYYELPPHLIAQHPAADRSSSRMMVLDRRTGAISHRLFSEITDFLEPGDCLVLNDTKVIPARFHASSRTIEMLLHRRLDETRWEALFKPGRKCRPGDTVIFGDGAITAVIDRITEDGLREVTLHFDGPWETMLEKYGEMPLPPYIKEKSDARRYQTVYAARDGSVAAPTAGLHFTDEILKQVQEKGVQTARITLHVGLGTFRPVKAEDITEHHMHSEYYQIEPGQASLVNDTKRNGKRVIAVGTTSCRTLESRAADLSTLDLFTRDSCETDYITAASGWTDIFIYPGYSFKVIDGLLTNFHLPESTLLMLVSAFTGREKIIAAYQAAIKENYRFYSFGDCMLIL